MLIGTVISAMWMVLEGHQTWREAGAALWTLQIVPALVFAAAGAIKLVQPREP
ncbi:hypothetical protein OHB12_08295 [Nocardia sp. NBC_01730]|uniref:hypothetical protein n=1 Tax=Nocardia sp. NBC_01730 TaxID=2975998 RepID=UPI002E13B405|nr:hypothetical protein OHB12_08295 [Nocardia sp. NBC_01730]